MTKFFTRYGALMFLAACIIMLGAAAVMFPQLTVFFFILWLVTLVMWLVSASKVAYLNTTVERLTELATDLSKDNGKLLQTNEFLNELLSKATEEEIQKGNDGKVSD